MAGRYADAPLLAHATRASGATVASRARAEMQEIGGKCGNNNKYTHWYSDNVDNIGYNFWWCAAFVSYVVRQCGVPTSVVPNFAYIAGRGHSAYGNKYIRSIFVLIAATSTLQI